MKKALPALGLAWGSCVTAIFCTSQMFRLHAGGFMAYPSLVLVLLSLIAGISCWRTLDCASDDGLKILLMIPLRFSLIILLIASIVVSLICVPAVLSISLH